VSVHDFIAAMRAAGVDPVEPIAGNLLGGKLIRFRCQGDGKKRNGWAIFLPVEQGLRTRARGRFGNYKQNTGTIEWFDAAAAPALSREDRERMRIAQEAEAERRARETAQAQDFARREAERIWEGAGPALPDHPYVAKKRMQVAGLRQSGQVLLVPMRDSAGRLWNLQRIFPDGAKRFLKGGRIIGLCAVIGPAAGITRGVFAEGYATGDAIAQALPDRPVVVAFNTANLGPVVAGWTRLHPRADWVIAADDDHLTGVKMAERGLPYQNPGVEKAREVAAAHGCRVAYPISFHARQINPELPPENMDFSDMLLAGGIKVIAEAFAGANFRPAAQPSLAERIGRAPASSSAVVGRKDAA
jgi:putative DNA primase/helicase